MRRSLPRPRVPVDNPSVAVPNPLSSGSRGAALLALVGIAVGSFMAALDSSIAHTLLPEMGRALGTDVATIEWVGTVFYALET